MLHQYHNELSSKGCFRIGVKLLDLGWGVEGAWCQRSSQRYKKRWVCVPQFLSRALKRYSQVHREKSPEICYYNAQDATKSHHPCTWGVLRSGWQSSHRLDGPNLIHNVTMKTWHISIEMPIKVSSPSVGDYSQFLLLGDLDWKEWWSHTQSQSDDGMTVWVLSALGISLCTQSKAGLQSVLVAEDALRCGDIRDGPGGAPAWLWLTEQL